MGFESSHFVRTFVTNYSFLLVQSFRSLLIRPFDLHLQHFHQLITTFREKVLQKPKTKVRDFDAVLTK
jgi:hypothetical protein